MTVATLNTIGLLLAPGLPLALVLSWCIPRLRRACCALAPWAALPALVLAFTADTTIEVRIDWMLLGTQLGLDDIRRVFLGFTALLWLGAGIQAHGYLAADQGRQRFDLFWMMTMAGSVGLILALDLASFYLFFALMTFAAYGLVIHDGGAEALRAGRVYLTMAVIGEALIIAGLLMAASHVPNPLRPLLAELPVAIAGAGNRDIIIACLWLGFGIKAGLPLLHMWLPLAHPVAPIPASAVLSGAMIKAGLLGWMSTLPLGVADMQGWGAVVIAIGFVAVFGAAVIGVNQRTPKTVLAYSSISQMGLITVGIGAGLHSALLWPALAPVIALYALHHGLAKGALFLGVAVARHPGTHIRPWLWVLLALPGLSIAGVMTSGMVSKLGLKGMLHAAGDMPDWWGWLPVMMGLGAIATTVLVARYLWLLRDQPKGDRGPAMLWAGWGVVLAAGVFAPFVLPVQAWGGRWPAAAGDVLDLVWPVLAGIAASVVAWRWLRPWPIPSGDLLAWVVVLAGLASASGARVIGRVADLNGRIVAGLSAIGAHAARCSGLSSRVEQFWRREAAMIFAALLIAMVLLW